MKNYEINEGTKAIISLGENKSKVLEDNYEYIINNSSYEIINHSCKYFGSSLEGRRESTKSLLGFSYKVPIIVDEYRNLIFFPTNDYNSDNCIWLSISKIKDLEYYKYNSTKVIFKDGKSIIIPISHYSIQNQIYRATRLDLIMRDRKKENNNFNHF